MAKDYAAKRSFDKTPEPPPDFEGNVDPGQARVGSSFMIHQHHARRLHFDLRLEMYNGKTPVLASWAVPRNLPLSKGEPHLAVHVEDHPIDYGTFSGTIPAGNYGAGEVRIFDAGSYEVLEQGPGKLTIRLEGERLRGVWHLNRTRLQDGKDEWIAILGKDERPAPDPLPELRPMMATAAAAAFDDDKWLFEPKWDGVRTLTACFKNETLLVSRNQNDITATYPELGRLHDHLVAIDAIVDGEIVALDKGRPSFEKLQSRINLANQRDIERAVKSIPVTFIAFDLLYLDGRSLIELPIEQRKEKLDALVVPASWLQVSSHVVGEGVALAEAAAAQRLEGVVAKKRGCPYRPGKRSRDWLKIKVVHEADVVIGGWTSGEGARSSTFGALLVGAYDERGLRFTGAVGTGFTDRMCKEIVDTLGGVRTDVCPFVEGPAGVRAGRATVRKPTWVEPVHVARVEFRELTSAGRLRAPSFKGLRDDKGPEECRFEDLAPPVARS